MSKQREALQLALEALTEVTGWQWAGPMRVMDEVEDSIAAIREALAEPARKPMTDYQIRQIDELVWKELTYEEKTFGQFALKMARAIERAHGITE